LAHEQIEPILILSDVSHDGGSQSLAQLITSDIDRRIPAFEPAARASRPPGYH
jgi:hypothetical protein